MNLKKIVNLIVFKKITLFKQGFSFDLPYVLIN